MRRRTRSRSGVLVASVVLAAGLAAAQPVKAQSPPFTGVCTTATPFPFGSNVMTNCDNTLLPHVETSIAVDPNDPQHLVGGSIANEVPPSAGVLRPFGRLPTGARSLDDYYTSFDGGRTWLNGHVPAGEGVSNSDPTVAFDSQGRVYYANLGFNFDLAFVSRGQGSPPGAVQVSRSDDGGVSFRTPVTVEMGGDEPGVAVDANRNSPYRDNVYMTWDGGGSGGESPIMFSVSSDGGQTWSAPKAISGANAAVCTFAIDALPYDGSCRDSNRPWSGVGADGTIYVAFHNIQADPQDPNNGQLLVVKSADGGVTWSAPVRASDIIPEDRLSGAEGFFTMHSLAVDSGTNGVLYVTWPDNRNGTIDNTNDDVFVVKSTDGGVHWSSPEAVSTASGDQFFPYAAVGPDGTLNVSFMDRSYDPANANYGVTLARRSPGNTSFTLQRVDTGLSDPHHSLWFSSPPGSPAYFFGDYSALAVGSDGVAHPMWTDMRRLITVHGFTGTTEDIMTAAIP
jgi:hypothetical protein